MLRDNEEKMTKMKQLKSTAAALLAVFALGAVVASAAQAEEAPSWAVSGVRLAKGQTRFIATKEVSPLVLTLGLVKLTCDTVEVLPGAAILGSAESEPGTSDETFVLKTCSVEGNGSGLECSRIAEPLDTTELKSELVLDAKTKTKILVLFQPVSGSLLIEFTFPKGCKYESTKVAGSFLTEALTDPGETPVETTTPEEQAKSWLLRVPSTQPFSAWLIKGGSGKEIETKELTSSLGSVDLGGKLSISLESGEEWGIGAMLGLAVTSGPIEFPKGVTTREVTLTNTGNVEISFKDGVTGAPGEISVDKTNFALHEISASKCGEKLPVGDSCAISITSAKTGENGEYKLEWGDATTTETTTRELKS
jgi:hypothetical protein